MLNNNIKQLLEIEWHNKLITMSQCEFWHMWVTWCYKCSLESVSYEAGFLFNTIKKFLINVHHPRCNNSKRLPRLVKKNTFSKSNVELAFIAEIVLRGLSKFYQCVMAFLNPGIEPIHQFQTLEVIDETSADCSISLKIIKSCAAYPRINSYVKIIFEW